MSAWKAITNGVVANTTKYCQKYWDYWCYYANIFKINPFLSNIPCPIERDVIVAELVSLFSSGMYGGKSYNKSSSSHRRSCVHLQDHPIGCKTNSPIQGTRQIPADCPTYGGRIPTSWTFICCSFRGTDHITKALLQSGTTLLWCSRIYHCLPSHHCLLLYSLCWWIHQTPICH